jgi:hypothetical protein
MLLALLALLALLTLLTPYLEMPSSAANGTV